MGNLVEWYFNFFFLAGDGVGVGVEVIENVIKAMNLLPEKCKYI